MRNVIEAVAKGTLIQCDVKQYPAIRAALTAAAEMKAGSQDEALSRLAMSEIERLDLLFANNPSERDPCGTAAAAGAE
jgi:hypothetical protein